MLVAVKNSALLSLHAERDQSCTVGESEYVRDQKKAKWWWNYCRHELFRVITLLIIVIFFIILIAFAIIIINIINIIITIIH